MIYKLLTLPQYQQALADCRFGGAPVDVSDGFIHFSTAIQVEETASKHFSGQSELKLLAFDTDDFGSALEWEPSRGGDLFPHLYDTLDIKKAKAVHDLRTLPDGSHQFPEKF
ncbi:MAG: DUF952 domain-containing protein [Rhizobiaceae bacterium]